MFKCENLVGKLSGFHLRYIFTLAIDLASKNDRATSGRRPIKEAEGASRNQARIIKNLIILIYLCIQQDGLVGTSVTVLSGGR